jgi:hypothetical protein
MIMNIFGYKFFEKIAKESVISEAKQESIDILLEVLEKYEKSRFDQSPVTVTVPAKAGRSSVPENTNQFFGSSLSPIPVDYPFNLLPMLENLQVYNRHISYAVENIVSLGNNGFTVDYGSGKSSSEISKMKEHIDSVMGGWYEHSDGVNGLVVDLFVQACVFGCISSERVIKDNLSGIKKIVRVSPVNVRFAYDKENDTFIPMQQNVNQAYGSSGGYIELNINTYSYIALKRYKNTPYGVAPYFSAIEDLLTEGDMINGFRNMMKRVGMLGFLSVLVKAPRQDEGETPEQYRTRCSEYLQSTLPQAEASFSKGIAVGFEGSHKFEISGNNMNTQGAEGLMDIVKKLVFAGTKQDPSMYGENFSTTESFAKVILTKMSKQVENYQTIVATFLEVCIVQELLLAGFNPKTIKVKFNRPLVYDEQKEVDTQNKRFDLHKKEYEQGIIDQVKFANLMGYDKPKEKEPRVSVNPVVPVKEDKPNKEELIKAIKGNTPQFNYDIPSGCDDTLSFAEYTDFGDSFINSKTKRYINKINEQFQKAVKKAKPNLESQIKKFDHSTDLKTWQDAVITSLFMDWQSNFSSKIADTIDSNVEQLYNYSRKNDNVFRQAKNFKKETSSFFDIPESVFGTLDYRTIEYLKTVDGIWLGKFITDQDTIDRMNKWVAQAFEDGNLPIGDNMSTQKFLNEFEKTVKLESWKIRRIVETNVSKSRTFGNVNYMNQAQVTNFEVVEVMDSKTCEYCSHADGMIMSVKSYVDVIDKVTSSDPSEIDNITPFATKYKPDDFKKLTASEVQGLGMMTPFHCFCRGRIVSDL